MKCPGCAGEIEKNCQYVCRTCWPKVPAKDRVKLANMHVKRIDVTSKLAKIARELRAKNGVILIAINEAKASDIGIAAAVDVPAQYGHRVLATAGPLIRVEIVEGTCHRER